jgi:hypothetical protein
MTEGGEALSLGDVGRLSHGTAGCGVMFDVERKVRPDHRPRQGFES